MKKLFTLVIFAALISIQANAQNNQNSSGFSSIFNSGPGDATKLAQAYLEPFFKGFGNSMSGGWTNTAKTKKLLHFDLRISGSGSFVPTSDQSFDYSKLGLVSVGPQSAGQSTITPTAGGSNNTTGAPVSIYSTDGNHYKLASFNLPSGLYNIIPAPQIQLTVGLIKNTDVTLRYLPNINSSTFGSSGSNNNFSIDMIGFGIKHDIIQDFGTAKHLMPFDLAIAFGYTRLTYSYSLSVTPQQGGPTNQTAKPKDAQQSTDFSNQVLSGKFSNINIQAIISKKLLFFTPFAAVGYNSCTTSIGTYGNYPITTGVDGPVTQNPVYTTYNNPVVINETSLSGLHADVGFQLTLFVLNLYASYSAGSYSSVNGGIGLGF